MTTGVFKLANGFEKVAPGDLAAEIPQGEKYYLSVGPKPGRHI